MGGRLGTLEQENAANSESVEGMQDKVRAVEKQLGEMRCHLNLAQRTERVEPVVPDTSWSRAPDGSLIRLSANGLVARAEMQKLLEVIVEASGKKIKDEHGDLFTCITNAPFARTHLYRSRGTDGIAATTVAHVLGSLRMANGRWKEHAVMGVDGGRLQAYIGNDRTEKQNAEARLGKLYMAELKKHFPDANLSFQKRTNEVLDEWVVIARVTIPRTCACQVRCGCSAGGAWILLGSEAGAQHVHGRVDPALECWFGPWHRWGCNALQAQVFSNKCKHLS